MGWFSNPDCPQCGQETTETGWCSPYPSYQCKPCIRKNKNEKEQQKKIDSLEKRIKELEGK